MPVAGDEGVDRRHPKSLPPGRTALRSCLTAWTTRRSATSRASRGSTSTTRRWSCSPNSSPRSSIDALDDVPEVDAEAELDNVMRPDEVRDCLTQEEALQNAPETEDGYFKGPRVG